MGPYQDSEPAIEEQFGLDVVQVQVFGPEDEVDRTLHLLRKEGLAEKEGEEVKQLDGLADPHQKILGLYDEFRPRLLRYIHSMYLKRDVAEEVIQETFLRLTTEFIQGNDIANVQGWIVRVAHNLVVDVIKNKERDAARTAEISSIPFETFVDPKEGPEEAYQRKEQINRMESALLTLSLQQRQCFNLRVQGFRYRDIADALGISEQRAAIVVKQVAVRLAALCGWEEQR
ncbi:sigma-70 family RNA polymerase sigma factor [Granulicella sp. dw_53]|uniref:RNA polymerase sigma factor n=1 Tax=Granulicella sp. dw_53 TaxID=2719792 RepID=UPI001BD52C50|nr:sigma-70 family RNA polymerase sigma factor [Granulicella sp. dw_53]